MSLELDSLCNSIAGFDSWNHVEKIKFFAWFLHSQRGLQRVTPADIRRCYLDLHLEEPTNIGKLLTDWTKKKPKTGLKDKNGYWLVAAVRTSLDSKYGSRPMAIHVDRTLKELPDKVPDLTQRAFLNETITCYRAGANRAAIVMVWNLAYDHLCRYVLKNKLAEFNAQYPVSYAKKHAGSAMKAVAVFDDFAELKESEVIQICRSANIISAAVKRILDEKLGTRNTYAHPSNVTVVAHTAEEIILNLVDNVVLKYV